MNVHSDHKSTARRGRGRPRVDDKRRLLLDAALRAFAQRGYHGTAVPELAQAAGVGTGTLYRYFANKEALVNEVFRDAKTRLGAALAAVAPPALVPGISAAAARRLGAAWFSAVWHALGSFAAAQPETFAFLEMQDHHPYLDDQSRQLELAVLAPLWLEGKRLKQALGSERGGPSTEVLMALVWGAFVGLVKASRIGYLPLDKKRLAEAGAACWQMISTTTIKPAKRGPA